MPSSKPSTAKKRNVVSDDMRKLIVQDVLHRGHTKAATAKRCRLPYSTVDSIVQKFEDTGEYRAQKKKGGAFRGRRWQQEHIDVLQRYVDLHPGATLKDIQLHLHQETGFNPSITNVHSVLKEVCHVSVKSVRIRACKRQNTQVAEETQTRKTPTIE